MVNIFKKNKNFRLFKKSFIYIFAVSILGLCFSSIIFIQTAKSERSLEWSVTLFFNETDGANDNIIFGEALDAQDGQDSYDTPKPPAGVTPYIYAWFDTDLTEPYNKLMKDIRKNPDTNKIWNLTVQWFPSDYSSSTEITISWSNSDSIISHYDTCILYDYDNSIAVADLLSENSFTYTSSALIPYNFQIICNYSGSPLNNPPYTPSSPHPDDSTIDVSISTDLNWIGGDPDIGDTVRYNIYFGTNNNPPKVVENQSNTKYNPGTLSYSTKYYWKIIAWDDKGNWAEGPIWHFTTKSQTQPPPPENIPPIADADGPYQGYINQTIYFDASNSFDSDGVIKYYKWDFENDGLWDTELLEQASINHVYQKEGDYTLILQVTDDKGATNTDTTIVTISPIEEGEVPPVADANGPYTGDVYQNITFDASSSYDSDGSIVNHTWDFGDGKTGYGIILNHVYTKNGSYNVRLTVKDNSNLINIDKTTANILFTDSDNDSWADGEEKIYGTDPDNNEDYPIDSDDDHIPDSEDIDDDNDMLLDTIEENLGSDSKNNSDVTIIEIDGIIHFLIDSDMDGNLNLFYNSYNGKVSDVDQYDTNQYLIDENGDSQWDYIYDLAGTLTPYKEEKTNPSSDLPFIIIIVIVLFLVILIVLKFVVYKKL
jgi:hypothetical protein